MTDRRTHVRDGITPAHHLIIRWLKHINMKFQDATIAEIDSVMNAAWQAFIMYRQTTLRQRADLMRRIAVEMEAAGDELIQTAMRETNLPEARLRNERARTMFQLTSYAAACEAGHWLEVRIDTAVPDKGDPDLRKWQVPIGPVVVFGASNFPLPILRRAATRLLPWRQDAP